MRTVAVTENSKYLQDACESQMRLNLLDTVGKNNSLYAKAST